MDVAYDGEFRYFVADTRCNNVAERIREESGALQREIEGLVALEYQMSRNVEELKRARAEEDFLRSSRGRVRRRLVGPWA